MHVVKRGEVEAVRHITFPQCIKGTGLCVTHTGRTGRGRAEGGGDTDEEDVEKRGMVVFFCPTFHFFFSFSSTPSPISDVVQVTYSAQGGSLLFLHLILLLLPPPSVFPLLS